MCIRDRNGTGNWYYAEYSWFRVLSEAESYTLIVDGFSGNVSTNAFGRDHYAEKFSTIERDNDRSSYDNCAARIGAGFWWQDCGYCHVNGASSIRRFYWYRLPGSHHLQLSRMWLQCK